MTTIAPTQPAARSAGSTLRLTVRMLLRRATIVAAVALTLSIGGLAVRAAAVWTAASAPLTVAPESATGLAQQLADEQARSAALEQQLTALADQTTDLTAALQTASERIASDAQTAKTLRDKLAAARKRLAAMVRATRPAATSPAAAPARSGGGGGGGEPGDSGEPGDG